MLVQILQSFMAWTRDFPLEIVFSISNLEETGQRQMRRNLQQTHCNAMGVADD